MMAGAGGGLEPSHGTQNPSRNLGTAGVSRERIPPALTNRDSRSPVCDFDRIRRLVSGNE